MGTSEGKLIVLEGVDGAGTTTHARLLEKRLREHRITVHPTAEPSSGPLGSLLRQTLTGRMVARSASVSPESSASNAAAGGRPPAWNIMALMFAADRLDHLDSEILPNLRDGVSVVCDRYYHSSVAYQSLTGGGTEAISWIRELNRFARRPDLTLVLDVPLEVAAERRASRRGSPEIFDSDEIQNRLCAFYQSLEQHFPGERVVHVDAVGTQEDVAARVLRPVLALFEAR